MHNPTAGFVVHLNCAMYITKKSNAQRIKKLQQVDSKQLFESSQIQLSMR